jgi:ribose 5-phosphate isomerase B
MSRQLVTEEAIKSLLDSGSKTLPIEKDAIVTPLAAELALAHGVKLTALEKNKGVEPTASKPLPASAFPSPEAAKVVVFGSDHGGFQLKEVLKKYAQEKGYQIVDVGTNSEEPCDYPDYAYAVATMVGAGKAWRGVMIDGAGIGSCVVANKVPGVRAACCHSEFVARNAREHNDTNVLTLGSRVVGSEVCKEILRIWLETWFSGGRHKQRVDKIVDVETKFLKTT